MSLALSPRGRGLLVVTLVAATLCVAAFLAWQAQGRQAPNVVRVVFRRNANYLVYFVARDRGLFSKHGILIQESELESSNLMVQALASRQADFIPSSSVPGLYSAEANSPGTFRFLYMMLMEKGQGNDAIIVRRDAPYQSLGDLRGLRIGTQPGATSLILLRLIFESAGLQLDSTVFAQEMEPRTLLQALEARRIQAVFAIEPLITQGLEAGISRVLEAEPIENRIMNPIPIAGGVVTAELAREHLSTVNRLSGAMNEAIDYVRANPDDARAIMAAAIGMPAGTAARLGINSYWKLQEVQPQRVQELADLFVRYGALVRPINTSLMLLRPTQ